MTIIGYSTGLTWPMMPVFDLRCLAIQPPELANFSGALTRDVSPFWCRFSSTRVGLLQVAQ